ncbi:DUF4097 family beta strand repeat-containing protein [Cellulosilyticum sp. I15G10I2]|uniref:DUF4097 family beta strand repeat-containing protein n=1 Tax=Cellulosilyticum sp. I15G10I2 TaxID=1892843 RepID=UPI00085C37AC|nr:DUF4097 family beta strand repeat-containing protein [Cellulosilyticum sp. I15G10I2]
MKKWIIGLFVIALISAVSTAALAGHIYYNEMQVYEDYQKRDLDIATLENIYINSAVPVKIAVTEGAPYIEFTQKFVDVLGHHPTYTLDIETKENSSYIILEKEKNIDMEFLVKESIEACYVYLPEQAINKLEVKNSYWSGDIDINLNTINIKELNVDASRGNIFLEGNYEKINVDASYGKIEIKSKGLAQVNISGNMECILNGNYSSIEIKNNDNKVWIESGLPADVRIEGSGDIRLRGSYKSIESNAYGNLDIKSDTICKAEFYNDGGGIKLDGAFDEVVIEAYHTNIDINTTIVPKRISILGDPAGATLMLPSNTLGLDVICKWKYCDDEDNRISNFPIQISDFPIQMKAQGENFRQYFFGDQSTKVSVQADTIYSIQLLDNGYKSENVVADKDQLPAN